MERLLELACASGTVALVSPQNWQFAWSYRELRRNLLRRWSLKSIAALGSRGFETISGEVVNVSLSIIDAHTPKQASSYFAIDTNAERDATAKARELLSSRGFVLSQVNQLKNPDHRVYSRPHDAGNARPIGAFAVTFQGIKSGDDFRWVRNFWEIGSIDDNWKTMQTTVTADTFYGGCNLVIYWGCDGRHLTRRREEGQIAARNRKSVAITQMGGLYSAILHGETFDSNISPIIITNDEITTALLSFLRSDEYKEKVRLLEPGRKINNTTFLKVAFDEGRWKKQALLDLPDGFPEPYSQDPTQWLFHGHPADSAKGTAVHVVLARVLGYRWPAEMDEEMTLSDRACSWIANASELPVGVDDGLVGVPAIAGRRALADRLREHLAAAFGARWSDSLERRLVAEADTVLDRKRASDVSLGSWLRDRAFRQHCSLFGRRPFVWQISDGLKDGFAVFVHYHRFDQATLRKLTYTLLGDWLARAKAENNALRYEKGRELQRKLERILEGEEPYDIFVRWKSLAQQPLRWDPDLNDGVRQNIRPFIMAGVLAHDLSKILKDKDRGKDMVSAPWYDVFSGERRNDHHTTLTEKHAARDAAAKKVEAAK